ncbi:MAG: anthranilate synthase component I [Firmicutes bacterium]|nr:anthranilate synthase component I [Bacillota bacterium]
MNPSSTLTPGKSEFLELARTHNLVPVYREIAGDLDTPISVFRKLCGEETAFLLESVEGGEQVARYSFIGARPFLSFTGKGGRGTVILDGCHKDVEGNPLTALRGEIAGFQPALLPGLPRFFGGAVGYFSYDMVRFFEELPDSQRDDLGLPDCQVICTELVVIFDHARSSILVVANARPDGDPEGAYRRACLLIDDAVARIEGPVASPPPAAEPPSHPSAPPAGNIPPGCFEEMVARAKEYIAAGDIFQVVLSQRFEVPLTVPGFEVYRVLRRLNPSPYMYYLRLGGLEIVGSSPEVLVRAEEGQVITRPLAGTRRRGLTPEEDAALEAELLGNEKERAEHIMLVDLGRNDIGRVAAYGSVAPTALLEVERYSHVMHIVSEVEGILAPGRTAYDAFEACFPAGTVSGAPKVRAMEIIDELEPTRRGPYAGAVGYFSFSGNMDMAITIRTIVITGGKAYVQAGAGIVADSDPRAENEECRNKAGAMLRALAMAAEAGDRAHAEAGAGAGERGVPR